jgi:uncharacterized protein
MLNAVASLVLVVACLVAVHAECAQATTQTGQPAVAEVRARAERGDPAAQHMLGKRYYVGDGVPRDYAQAVVWFRKAAEHGLPDAQVDLGLMYGMGLGVAPDESQLLAWCERAAAQGHVPATDILAVMYEEGRGVPKDFAKAVKWRRVGAERGDAGAQFQLGLLCAERGTPADLVEAFTWIDLAASRTSGEQSTRYAESRDEIARRMTPGQIADAQRLAQEWAAAFAKRR